MDDELKERLKRIKCLLLDVDGVLTDGGLYYSNSGEQFKKFCVRDGLGIKLIQQAGIEVAFVTGLQSNLVDERARSLGITEVIQGRLVKEPVVEELIKRKGLDWTEVAYVGDDLIDVDVMRLVGFAAAVADAMPGVKNIAHYTTAQPGGRGAVREICDMLLAAHH
ncbi:MAG TPA: HAD-IIIA family hydrolase [Acidobacteriota bacterium]|nr:HAD-IIIA family hydrolase [Acidobacteriota bacterium]